MSKKLWVRVAVVGVLAGAILLPRVFSLDRFLTADEKRWQTNTAGFTRNLATGMWGDLLQQPHPGITTQWLGALTIASDSWAIQKIPLVLGQSILVLIITYVFFRLWGEWPALLLGGLLALNPILVAHTRVYAMDSLLGLFTLLGVGLLLLWHETHAVRYLLAAGAASALAILSKLPGILLVPFSLGVLVWWDLRARSASRFLRTSLLWFAGCGAMFVLAFPSLLIHPGPVVGNILEFFSSDDYRELHQSDTWYYLSTLTFSSTPLQMLALTALPLLWQMKMTVRSRVRGEHVTILSLFAVLFFIEMSLGGKKGDRYILPMFLCADALVVASAVWAWERFPGRPTRRALAVLVALGVLWQGWILWTLHPYALAYVNPFTHRFVHDRRMGWGEGLDLAAEYVNAKPGSTEMTVASLYPIEFGYRFRGRSVPVHEFEHDSVSYVVLYRAMLERGAGSPEENILETFRGTSPEKVITINNLPYAWIYKR